ncbi:hypothetical protein D3C85_1188410 [compost metagenome]
MLAEVLAAKAAGLAVVAVVGRDVQAGVHKTLRLAQFGAGAVEVDLLDMGDADADFPVHQALVFGHGGGLGAEQLVALAEGREGLLHIR